VYQCWPNPFAPTCNTGWNMSCPDGTMPKRKDWICDDHQAICLKLCPRGYELKPPCQCVDLNADMCVERAKRTTRCQSTSECQRDLKDCKMKPVMLLKTTTDKVGPVSPDPTTESQAAITESVPIVNPPIQTDIRSTFRLVAQELVHLFSYYLICNISVRCKSHFHALNPL
jgi:hypothetical protein